MYKNPLIQMMECLTSAENQIRLQKESLSDDHNNRGLSPENYQELIAHLIFLALPSPSQHLH